MSDEAFSVLLNSLSDLTYDKFSADFKVTEASYTSANGTTSIRVHILVPKHLLQGQRQEPRPLMIRIHGGYLVTGSSLYPPWFSDWVLKLAIREGAIIISPNYRLMPEANGTEILADMDAFWGWLRGGNVAALLGDVGSGTLRTNLDQTLVLGESAGGYLAMQLALSHPQDISALLAVYPLLDPESDFYTTLYSKPILGVQNLPISLLEDRQKSFTIGNQSTVPVVTEADPPDRLALSFACVQHGRYLDLLGRSNKTLFPIKRVSDDADADAAGKGGSLPPMFIFHGMEDSAVPSDGTLRFVEALSQHRPRAKCRLELQHGDHGFDFEASIDGTDWLRRGLDFTNEHWLKNHVRATS